MQQRRTYSDVCTVLLQSRAIVLQGISNDPIDTSACGMALACMWALWTMGGMQAQKVI